MKNIKLLMLTTTLLLGSAIAHSAAAPKSPRSDESATTTLASTDSLKLASQRDFFDPTEYKRNLPNRDTIKLITDFHNIVYSLTTLDDPSSMKGRILFHKAQLINDFLIKKGLEEMTLPMDPKEPNRLEGTTYSELCLHYEAQQTIDKMAPSMLTKHLESITRRLARHNAFKEMAFSDPDTTETISIHKIMLHRVLMQRAFDEAQYAATVRSFDKDLYQRRINFLNEQQIAQELRYVLELYEKQPVFPNESVSMLKQRLTTLQTK